MESPVIQIAAAPHCQNGGHNAIRFGNYSGNARQTLRRHARNIRETCEKHSEDTRKMLRRHPRDTQENMANRKALSLSTDGFLLPFSGPDGANVHQTTSHLRPTYALFTPDLRQICLPNLRAISGPSWGPSRLLGAILGPIALAFLEMCSFNFCNTLYTSLGNRSPRATTLALPKKA